MAASPPAPPGPKSTPLPTSSPPRTEVLVNVYDLLPPGKLSTALWILGFPLLHTGVHLPSHGLEYAFGGHARPSVTGVYSSAPGQAPPGARHRRTLRLGVARITPAEAGRVITAMAAEYPGPGYDLLGRNCNHFADALVRKLLGRRLPGWVNRAAAVGTAVPCLVPGEWLATPDVETADGMLVEEEGDEGRGDERMIMLVGEEDEDMEEQGGKGGGVVAAVGPRRERSRTPPPRVVDNRGLPLPVAERVPLPRH